MITANDFAGAWAVDENGDPLLPTVPSDPMQRVYAYRAGVNIIMYMLTGNYKSDQVHVPILLEAAGAVSMNWSLAFEPLLLLAADLAAIAGRRSRCWRWPACGFASAARCSGWRPLPHWRWRCSIRCCSTRSATR